MSASDFSSFAPMNDKFYDNFLFFSTLFFVYLLRYKVIVYYRYLETKIDPNIAEFSIAISNLPQNENLLKIEEELRELFEGLNHYNGITYHVHDMVFCFRTNDYLKLLQTQDNWKNTLLYHNERDEAIEQDQETIEKIRQRHEKRQFYINKINEYSKKIMDVEKEISDALREGIPTNRFMGKAIVVFKTQIAAYDLLQKYDVENPILYRGFMALLLCLKSCWSSNAQNRIHRLLRPLIQNDHFVDQNQIIAFRQTQRLNLFFRNKKIYVIKAVNPNNIIWKNFGYSYFVKFFFRVSFFSFALGILAISFWLIRKCNNYRFEYIKEHQITGFKKFLMNGAISLTILTFNAILNQFILHTIQFEQHEKRTNELSSQSAKIVLKMFLNTTVMIFLLCFNNGDFDTGFLLYQILLFMSITAIFSPLVGFWDFTYFVKLFKRYQLSKQHKIKETQEYMSKIYENPEYNIVLNYSGFIFHFMNLTFYANFFPFWGFFLILIYYIYNFFLQKWLFIRRNSVINEFRNELNITVLNIIDFCPFLIIVAQYLRSRFIFHENIIDFFFALKILMAVFTFAFPNERLIDYFFLMRYRNFGDYDKYREAFKKFNYTQKNPAYKSLHKVGKMSTN